MDQERVMLLLMMMSLLSVIAVYLLVLLLYFIYIGFCICIVCIDDSGGIEIELNGGDLLFIIVDVGFFASSSCLC